jgi:hypothetical protein
MVIIEGIRTSAGVSPAWYPSKPQDCGTKGPSSCEETEYAAVIGRKSGAGFIGGEPEEKDILAAISTKEFGVRDLIAYYVIRQIPQWKREGSLEKEDLSSLVQGLIRYYEKTFSAETHLDLPAVRTWYRQKTGITFDVTKITTDDLSPIDNTGASYLQTVSARVSKARENHLANLIEDSVNKYTKVMVVYGSGHLIAERAMLADMFGQPVNRKLFPR